jgi:hypothetical protein
MLPDGAYTWTVEAVADDGQTTSQQGQLIIENADTTKPELQGFSVYPQVFTPNQDGIDDRVTVNYSLTKEAEVSVYLITLMVKRATPLPRRSGTSNPASPPSHLRLRGG